MPTDDYDYDPSIIGRRTSDGDYISFREAVKMFATKEELSAMHTSVAMMAQRVDGLPSRAELEARWKYEDTRYEKLDGWVAKIDGKVDELLSDRIPKWVMPIVAVFAPMLFGVVLIVVNHNWK